MYETSTYQKLSNVPQGYICANLRYRADETIKAHGLPIKTHQEKTMGTQQSPLMAHWLPLTLCTSFLYWAASSRGRAGDRGNPYCHRRSGHVREESSSFKGATWQSLQEHHSRRLGLWWWWGNREEAAEQWGSGCDTTAGLAALGGNPLKKTKKNL